jgi:dUTP pyrophosphatase
MVKNGERVCQMVIAKYEKVEWEETDNLDDTERGEGGFGHTGSL